MSDKEIVGKAFLDLAKYEEDVAKVEDDIEHYRLKMMQPMVERRDNIIKNIPEFWKIVLSQHTSFADFIRASDFKYIDLIDKVKVDWLIIEDPKQYSVGDFRITLHFNSIDDDFNEQTVSKVFKLIKGDINEGDTDDETEEERLVSEPVDIQWPKSYDSINPSLIEDKHSKEGKKSYRQGMKSFFGWFKWTGKKPGKEFPHGDSLATLFSEDIYPYCVKYYTEAQRDLEDEEEDDSEDNSSEEPLDLEVESESEESDKKRRKI
ncbi:uncharacterized protein GVI51_J07579 [Nakaseomyces glabratus]|uniref:Vacuolar protein sorting-associated protein 75 n=2 Tax=Candida glabrata TaxID=5478 RepID=Q6FP01_CANGA|nr:uncharacterized protein CAGL0J07722g [Nakaseomyces glabratus]KAH7598462.1 Nucleosome assembly protein (NAP) [Nakaseomyces glabratus]KAH7603891.1 Nucleosome assembly protein (NAP) [Nakaseomyces glabratus]KAI8385391.1 Nucleosome assembly protein (NAP) [Nakaseomyces glabratus]KAI8395455.1 Nucleosome assembly protein (NAP) [Nakaseomyces glabratus]KAJ9571950.1 Vacuolar protein sorting-associated protein 75 [Nakaseomyces glabratus]|eukprot:XP_448043.1 uncharacterized protein CAGL0J07722g [[Candida] glabrata]